MNGGVADMDRIGKYIVIKDLVTTGFSNIYLCRDPDLEVHVAVKVFKLKDENLGDNAHYGPAVWLTRFVEEARLLARLDHPHIVSVRELSATDDGMPYFVMPFIEANLIYEIGKDDNGRKKKSELRGRKKPRRASVERTVQVVRQVVDALVYMHERDLIHRDIKPGNVLLTRKEGGSVKICDFGMVKFPDWSLSRSGIWIGTLDYIAPEQRRSAREVGPSADVYSAGALAYRMLTAKLPEGNFPAPHKSVEGVPESLSELIMRCLARDKELRPQNAREMLALLDKAMEGDGGLDLAPLPPDTEFGRVKKGVRQKAKVVLKPVSVRTARRAEEQAEAKMSASETPGAHAQADEARAESPPAAPSRAATVPSLGRSKVRLTPKRKGKRITLRHKEPPRLIPAFPPEPEPAPAPDPELSPPAPPSCAARVPSLGPPKVRLTPKREGKRITLRHKGPSRLIPESPPEPELESEPQALAVNPAVQARVLAVVRRKAD